MSDETPRKPRKGNIVAISAAEDQKVTVIQGDVLVVRFALAGDINADAERFEGYLAEVKRRNGPEYLLASIRQRLAEIYAANGGPQEVMADKAAASEEWDVHPGPGEPDPQSAA